MPENPYQDIAKEFVNLWQKQMSSVMGDKQFIHAMLELFQNMQVKPNAKANTAASNPSDAPVAEHRVITELAFRLAMCEKRLAALESKLEVGGNAAKGTAKRSKPGSKKPPK
jgi:hypothetical protein